MALKAASAGKHIVCEKPLARTTEQAQEIVNACRKAGVQLLVAHVVRFFPEYALAHSAVAEGQIGKPGCGPVAPRQLPAKETSGQLVPG